MRFYFNIGFYSSLRYDRFRIINKQNRLARLISSGWFPGNCRGCRATGTYAELLGSAHACTLTCKVYEVIEKAVNTCATINRVRLNSLCYADPTNSFVDLTNSGRDECTQHTRTQITEARKRVRDRHTVGIFARFAPAVAAMKRFVEEQPEILVADTLSPPLSLPLYLNIQWCGRRMPKLAWFPNSRVETREIVPGKFDSKLLPNSSVL